ncbi:histidinol dehydrogenase [Methanosalsum natronophilum]|uniref:histidinol dehydrogenase n=1 Tax=Methanosalsum natronophilum TaxID=768733 RepID=UPI0035B59672
MLCKNILELTREEKSRLMDRGCELLEVKANVQTIVDDVRKKGDTSIKYYTKKFDGVEINSFEVPKEDIEQAYSMVDSEIIEAIQLSASNIRKFHEAQVPEKLWYIDVGDGVKLGQKCSPLESIGAYVPGGSASYPSTALMTIIPAKVAGVKKVIMCTPPGPDGNINPLTLAAAKVAGADKVYSIGGVQAIAAMAFGTESVEKVTKIVGPGNVYVTTAKMLIRDHAEIDFPAGPSEVLIIADDTADPKMVASDIIAQSEHDPCAVSVLVTSSSKLAKAVEQEVNIQSTRAKRRNIIDEALQNAAILVAASIEECVQFSNEFAPEHLEIMVSEPDSVLENIDNAGSIFVGNFAPVSAGDYTSGTNHVLPTAGYAKMYSGLNVNHFLKYSTIQKIDKPALKKLSNAIILIAEKEGLYAHADAVRMRFMEED